MIRKVLTVKARCPYGSITAIEIESSTSILDAWTWLIRLSKYLRRAICDIKKEANSGNSGDILEDAELVVTIAAAGPLLLLKYQCVLSQPMDFSQLCNAFAKIL